MISLQEKEIAVEVRKNAQIALNEKVKAYLESLQPEHTFRIFVGVRRGWFTKAHDLVIDVEYLNEKGERDFGSSFTMYFENNTLKMNCGTIGSWDKTYKYQIARVKLIAKMFEDIETVESFFGSIEEVQTIIDSEKIIDSYEEEQETIKKEERATFRQSVEDSLEVGQIYNVAGTYNTKQYKISRITPKKVYYTFTDDNGNFYGYESIMWKDEFVTCVVNNVYVKM